MSAQPDRLVEEPMPSYLAPVSPETQEAGELPDLSAERLLQAAQSSGKAAVNGSQLTAEVDIPEQQQNEDIAEIDAAAPNTDLVKAYLKEIGRTPLLTAEQEVELSKSIEAGVFAAEALHKYAAAEITELPFEATKAELLQLVELGQRDKQHLIQANLRLVVSVAKRYTGRNVPFLDLIQEGNLGVIRAVEKFDYRKGFKFSTYASWWIRQAIHRSFPEQSKTIRLPVHVFEKLQLIKRSERELHADGLSTTPEAISEKTGIDIADIISIKKHDNEPISFQAIIGEEGEAEFGDMIEDEFGQEGEDAILVADRNNIIAEALTQLTERERSIIGERFGLHDGQPKTLDEIGRRLGLTRERIRQLENNAIFKLRNFGVQESLRDYQHGI